MHTPMDAKTKVAAITAVPALVCPSMSSSRESGSVLWFRAVVVFVSGSTI